MPESGGVVLVTGATGAVGPAVVNALLNAGEQVKILSRSSPGPALFAPSVVLVRGDVCDLASAQAAVAGTSAVIHLAGLVHAIGPAQPGIADYHRVNVEGTRVMAEACVRAGVRRFILASTIAVYGSSRRELADETALPAPDTPYARSKLAAEEILRQYAGSGRLDPLILRFAATYGARMKGNYLRLVRAISRGRFVMIGAGANRRSLIHEDDLAAAVLASLRTDRRTGTYNVADGDPHTVRAIVDAIYAALGRKPPRYYVPLQVARSSVSLIDGTGALLGLSPFLSTALDKFVEDVVVDAGRVRKELAFTPRVNLVAGWRASVARMCDAGVIDS